MHINFTHESASTEAIVIGITEGGQLCSVGKELDTASQNALSQALAQKKFQGKTCEFTDVVLSTSGQTKHVFILGLGNVDALTALQAQQIGGRLATHIKKINYTDLTICFCQLNTASLSHDEAMANVASGYMLRAWEFTRYKTKKAEGDCSVKVENFLFKCTASDVANKYFAPLKAVVDGVFLTRSLVTEPSNVIYPATFVEQARQLKALGVKIEVLDESDMSKLGMNALLGVGQGSERESHLLVLSWNGGTTNEAPVAIVGKGVTFDTGGISLKPSANMDEMKMDMGGAGVVVGLIAALAARKAKVNVVGVAGLVENMPSGSAQKPGDVVKSMSGQTIEILDTDAEGRLVLSDALWYTQNRFKPKIMIDLATLTGAILVCLAHEYGGLFSNNDELAERLLEVGKDVDEPLWRMPLCDTFDKDIDSVIADVKNLGTPRLAGSSTAAHFLKRFVNNVPWAHLDIAGTAWIPKDKPLSAKGASAFGVRLLNEFIQRYYEPK